MSNETILTLQSVQPPVSGRYNCEVSADAPSFHTMFDTGDLEVVGKLLKMLRITRKSFALHLFSIISWCIDFF